MFEDVTEKFLQSKRAGGAAPSTITSYRRVLQRYAAAGPAWPPLVDDLESYLAQRRQTVARITAEGDYRVLSVFFNWCHRRQIIEKNPIDIMDKPRRVKNSPKPVAKAKIQALFAAIETAAGQGDMWAIRDRALFRLAYDTGARASGLADMRRENIDMPGQGIYAKQKGEQWTWLFYGPTCAAALRAWLLIHPGGPWLFVNQHHAKMTRRRVYIALKSWCKNTSFDMTVHQLRHSYATHAIRNGIDLRIVQAQMGHSNINTTAQYLAASATDRRMAHMLHAPGEGV